MGVHEFGGQLLRHLLAKVLRDAKPNVSGQRDVDLRQLYDVHLFEVRIQRGNVTSVNLHILKTKKKKRHNSQWWAAMRGGYFFKFVYTKK